MHNLLLLVVLFGWVLFLFLSWQIATPLYVVGIILSLTIFWKIIQSQRRRSTIGKRAMMGRPAIVLSVKKGEAEVDFEGEIWRAVSSEPLQPGQKVIIDKIEGLILRVVPEKSGEDDPPHRTCLS